MASQLTEYERRRLENINRNHQMMKSLTIQSKLSQLSPVKRQRVEKCKSYRIDPVRKEKKSVEIRRSLRSSSVKLRKPVLMKERSGKVITQTPRPIARPRKEITQTASTEQHTATRPIGRPRKNVLSDSNAITQTQGSQELPQLLSPLGFRDSYSVHSESDVQAFAEKILSISSSWPIVEANGVRVQNKKASTREISHSYTCEFEFGSLRLEPDNIARVVPGRLYAAKFFPTRDLEMVVAGNEFGNVGFWDMKSNDVNCIHLFRPHSAPVSGIVVHPFSMSKVYTSCYDGSVRVMNIDKQVFDLVHSSDGSIYSLAQKPDDVNTIYFGEDDEVVVKMWDERMGKTSASWNLHEDRINTIDFNSANTNIMATSSTDGTACVWDLRKMSDHKSMMLKAIKHKKPVHAAYFSPSGIHLASKSTDDNIGVLSGKNFEDESMVHHENGTRSNSFNSRPIWGWDDDHLYVGSKARGVDIFSVSQKASVHTLRSKQVTSAPRLFDAHPWKVGALASGDSTGGRVCVWTPPS